MSLSVIRPVSADNVFMVCASRASSPPPLDWPLPNQFEQCELKLEVQPRSYHRAHYETEGSRGSIKAAPAGHPVVKVSPRFIYITGYCREKNTPSNTHISATRNLSIETKRRLIGC